MTKKDFILVGAAFQKKYLWLVSQHAEDAADEVLSLASDLAGELLKVFPRFNARLWLDYVTGNRGPNGGKPK